MPCYHPLDAYQSHTHKTKNNKSLITFTSSAQPSNNYSFIRLPCSQCNGCRIQRSKEWAIRCVHEASLYPDNCFITLTFNKKNLNPRGELRTSDFQKFMKRLRKKYNGLSAVANKTNKVTFPIRYFHCGEYGSDLNRPHHHACLFNFDFPDKTLWSVRKNVSLYRSASLEKLWPYGFSTIGSVNFQSAAYVARYIIKKVNGPDGEQHYQNFDPETGEIFYKKPEYITMSRRPGIAKGWFDKFSSDVYPKDYITHEGRKFKSPKFYDNLYDNINPTGLEKIKIKRKLAIEKFSANSTRKRLSIREKVQNSHLPKLKRGYENEETTLLDL